MVKDGGWPLIENHKHDVPQTISAESSMTHSVRLKVAYQSIATITYGMSTMKTSKSFSKKRFIAEWIEWREILEIDRS